MTTAWFYTLNGEQKGPVATEILMALVANRQLSSEDLVWKKGLSAWVTVAQVPELVALTQAATSQPTPKTVQRQVAVKALETEELRLAPDPDEALKKVKQVAHEAVTQPNPARKSQAGNTSKPQTANWYYSQNGQQQGPVTAQFLKEKAISGELRPTDHLWKDGLKDWVAAGSLPGLKFPAAQSESSVSSETDIVVAAESVVVPNENSIFDLMNDPSFASAPASTVEKPNVGLATMTSSKKKKKKRKSLLDDDNVDIETYYYSLEFHVFNSGTNVIVFLVLGIIFAGLAFWHYTSHVVRLHDEGTTVEAKVIKVDQVRRGWTENYNKFPTVGFTTKTGQYVTVNLGKFQRDVMVGELFELIYLPETPEKAEIKTNLTYTIFSSTWMWLACGCFLLTIVSMYRWYTGRQKLAMEA